MQRTIRLVLSLFIIVGIVTVIKVMPVFSQEQKEASLVKTVSGEVALVDLKNSIVAIKHLENEESQSYNTTTLYVDDSTSIERDDEAIDLADLKIGDKVITESALDKEGKDVATSIWVGINE